MWIRSSGVPFFTWFSPEYANEEWNINELFFSGFFSAINSSSEIFFNDDHLHYIEFTHYKIFIEKNANNDLFVLITGKEAPNEIPIAIMNRMLEYYYESTLSKINEIQQDDGFVEEQFLQILLEIEHEWIKNQGKSKNRLRNGETITSFQPQAKKTLTNELPSSISKDQNELNETIKILEHKTAAFSTVGRTLGHALNNVLSTIMGNINLSKLDIPEDSDTYESLEEAEQACFRARDIITQLLNVSKSINSQTISDQIEKITETSKKVAEEAPSEKMAETTRSLILGKGKVLLMDDDEYILDTGEKMIKRLGYEVEKAKNFLEALKKYQEHKEKDDPFKVVILDFSEIGGVGEFGSLVLKNLDNQINAIVSSGYIDDPIFTSYRKYGYSGVLKKPYNLGELSLVLSKIIHN